MGRDVYAGDTGQGIFLFNCGSVIPEPFFTDTGPRLSADEPAMRYSEPYERLLRFSYCSHRGL